jgi:hypothetical protein
MRYLILILLPIVLLAQNPNYSDQLSTKRGDSFECQVLIISDGFVKLIYADNVHSTFEFSAIENLIIAGKGEVLNSKDGLIFDANYLNKFLAKRNGTDIIEPEDGNRHDYLPGDHELLLMPTAYTMNKGGAYFSDYELFFLNYSFGVSSNTHIGLFSLFPVTGDFVKTLSFGLKQNYLRKEKIQAAVWGSFTPESSATIFGNVFSYDTGSRSIHLGIGGYKNANDGSELELLYMAGINATLSRRVNLMLEYTNASSALENDFSGLMSIGLRFKGENISWDLGGIRPLDSTGGLFMFPLFKATIAFGNY